MRYASSSPSVPPPYPSRCVYAGDNCVLRQGKGTSAYTRHNTICATRTARLLRLRVLRPRALANARDYYGALRRGVAVRRLMENALLSLIAVYYACRRFKSPPLYPTAHRTCRRPDTSVLTHIRRDSSAAITAPHLIAPRDIADASFVTLVAVSKDF